MWKQILLPLDGSKLSESALPWALLFAKSTGAAVKVIHVIEKDAPERVHSDAHLRKPQEAQGYLEAVANDAFEGSVPVSLHLHEAPVAKVAESISAHISEFGSDLVVMSTHGRSGLKQFMVGSIAQRIVAAGRTPLLLIPPGAPSPDKLADQAPVLIPLDGSDKHEAALESGCIAAAVLSAPLRLMFVVPTLATRGAKLGFIGRLLPRATSTLLDIEEESARNYLNGQREKVLKTHPGWAVAAAVERGDPVKLISEAAEKEKTAMLVMATHGKAGLTAFWAGSMGARICQASQVPMLLIPVNS